SEELIEEVVRMDSAIQKAEEKMAFVAQDKEALRAYQMREMAMSDWTSGLNHAKREGRRKGRLEGRRKGRLEGRQEGRLEKAIEIARNLRGVGVSIEKIANVTGLSFDEIVKL
ncbi:MAG: hypothetical protein LBC62_09270, partial [Treponema sp.]|nr:hypothetical protein [Treponema sp.]